MAGAAREGEGEGGAEQAEPALAARRRAVALERLRRGDIAPQPHVDGPQPRRARLQRHALVDHVDERRRKAAEAAQLRHKHVVVGGLVDWVWAGLGYGWDQG